jgi:hypothetical protein
MILDIRTMNKVQRTISSRKMDVFGCKSVAVPLRSLQKYPMDCPGSEPGPLRREKDGKPPELTSTVILILCNSRDVGLTADAFEWSKRRLSAAVGMTTCDYCNSDMISSFFLVNTQCMFQSSGTLLCTASVNRNKHGSA